MWCDSRSSHLEPFDAATFLGVAQQQSTGFGTSGPQVQSLSPRRSRFTWCSSVGEREVRDLEAEGAIPSTSTHAGIAQWLEHLPCSPFVRSRAVDQGYRLQIERSLVRIQLSACIRFTLRAPCRRALASFAHASRSEMVIGKGRKPEWFKSTGSARLPFPARSTTVVQSPDKRPVSVRFTPGGL